MRNPILSVLSRRTASRAPFPAADARATQAAGRRFLAFLAGVFLIAGLAGHQFTHLLSRMNEAALQRADRLMELEESLDDASIGLGQQIQEWKDMLLRANSNALYGAHRQAFIDASIGVQQALLRAGGAMQGLGMDTQEIEHLAAEHKALLSKYITAHGKLDPQHSDSPRAADQQVVGIDRDLQRHLAAVRAAAELKARQGLTSAAPEAKTQHVMLGALAAAALIFMALFGFAVAIRLEGQDTAPRSAQ